MTSARPGPSASNLPLDRILPSAARFVAIDRSTPIPPLPAAESVFVETAVPRRREEFARGRAAARAALVSLGEPPVSIPVGQARQPLWPEGVVGSISHCADLAWAAVASSHHLTALGIDVEYDRRLPKGVRTRVLAPDEAQAIQEVTGTDMVGFGAKECVHKAVHPVTGVWLDFHDVEVVPEPGGGLRVEPVEVTIPEAVRLLLAELQLRWAVYEGLIFTSAWVLRV